MIPDLLQYIIAINEIWKWIDQIGVSTVHLSEYWHIPTCF